MSTNNKGDLVVSVDGGAEGGELTLKKIENFNLQTGAGGATLQLGDLGGSSDDPIDLSGGDGGDTIDASESEVPVIVDAGTGDDVVSGGNAADEISGGEGSDVITGGGGDDIIDAGVGDDQVIWAAGDGNDVINGGEGEDQLDVTLDDTQPSELSISSDADGNVILTADDGTELVLDEVEEIVINAGAAGTTITIGDLSNTDISQNTLYFNGGIGDDTFDASVTDRRIVATGNDGSDTLLSGTGNDMLDGGAGDDVLNAGGGSGVDTVLGGSGDDLISTTLGDDFNSLAVDIVDGGADNDQLDVNLVENTPQELLFRVESNGDGSFSITSEDLALHETLHVSNVETLRLIASEGALSIELGALGDSTLAANGVNFEGSNDADFLDGSDTDVVVEAFGGGGDDNLIGGSQNDLLFGGDNNDSLSGDEGDDVLRGEAGNDIMDGGAGWDKADYSAETSGVTVDLGIFVAQNTGAAGMDTLVNIEEVEGSAFDDTLSGNDFDNTLSGGDGNDTISGGLGWDFVFGGNGNDTLDDPDGAILSGDAGDDTIDGFASYWNDPTAVQINLSNSAYDVFGGGSQIVNARQASDGYGDTDSFLSGTSGVEGSALGDHFQGSSGDDVILGRAGNDVIIGGDGDDYFRGGSGDDDIDGGAGVDWADYRDFGTDHNGAATQGINLNLNTGAVTDSYGDTDTLTGVENAWGSAFADVMIGDGGDNVLLAREGDDNVSGGDGNDTLGGWTGNDTIDGGAGDDIILGDADDDTMTGGAGADTFRFLSVANGNDEFGHEIITDFNVAEDVLEVVNLGISSLSDVASLATENAGDTIITIDANNSITLQGVTLASLTDANFLYADPPEGGIGGTDGDDVLEGTSGNDVMNGGLGNDTLFGRDGDDNLNGDDGDDRLFGGQGADSINGGNGIDSANYSEDPAGVTVNLVTGTATDGYGDTDSLTGIENITGTIYSDTLTGDDGNNFFSADNGNSPTGGDDVIVAGGGNDYIWSGKGVDTVDGGPGLDFMSFTADEVSNFGPGLNITMAADGSMSVLNTDTGEVEDSITGIEGVLGSRGDDVFLGNQLDNFFNPFFGNDFADGGTGTDTLYFGIFNGIHVDLEAGTAYRPSQPFFGTTTFVNFENVIGNANDDTLIGNSGDNLLEGIDGNDTLRGGDGADTLHGGSVTVLPLTLFMGSDDPDFDGFDIADYSVDPAAVTVDLAAGTATDGWGKTDTLISIDGVIGSEFNDTLIGDSRDNNLEGSGGDDVLTGGAGADGFLLSDDGNDNAAFGLDVITDFDTSEDYVDVEQFPGIQSISDLTISQDGPDTLITFDASNVVRLSGVTVSALTDDNFLFAEPQNLVGTPGDDFLEGGAGNDTIAGLEGNDTLNGGDGNDVIDAGPGNDNVDGGAGNDNIFGGLDTDWENINGGPGDDLIDIGQGGGDIRGGTGDDTITGTNDWYEFVRGEEGDDVLIDPDGSGHLAGGPGNDSLDGNTTYQEDDTGKGVEANLDTTTWDVYDDGTTLLLPAREARDPYNDTDTLEAGVREIIGTNYDDYIRGSDVSDGNFQLDGGNDTFIGLGGNDNINPGSGNDYIDGGDENWNHISFWDTGRDSAGSPTQGIVFNVSDSDFSYSWMGNSGTAYANENIDNFGDTDQVFNIDGISGTDFDDVIVGHDDHNWIEGGAGNDQIYGGDVAGDNLIGGPGNDLLDGQGGDHDQAWYQYIGASNGIVVDLGTGTASNDGHGDVDTLVSIESVQGSEFDDSITGDANRNNLHGGEGNDVISGEGGDDFIDGQEGDDEIYAGDGYDYLNAGRGNDLFDGGADIDVLDYAPWTGTTSGVTIDLTNIVSAGGYTNVVEVVNDGHGTSDYLRGIEEIHGSDHADHLTGDANDNRFEGRVGDDTLIGGDGNDHLWGDDDNDILDGGNGEDVLGGGENDDNLTGGSGRDQFVLNRMHYGPNGLEMVGFGNDVIQDFVVGEDVLDVYNVPEFTSVAAMLSYAISAPADPDLVLEYYTSDNVAGIPELNRLTLIGVSPTDLQNMEIWFSPIRGTNGDDIIVGTSDNENFEGLEGNDQIDGQGGNDNFDGGPGDDQLIGGANHDWFIGGTGSDYFDGGGSEDHLHLHHHDEQMSGVILDLTNISASAGGFNDVVAFADGTGSTDYVKNIQNLSGTNFNDILTGGPGHNNLSGWDGDDQLSGGDDHDNLRGDDGNDFLYGNNGDDNLTGGRGNDLLDGGAGEDQADYRWNGEENGVSVNLASQTVSDDGFGGTDTLVSIEGVQGSEWDDFLSGDANHNNLQGREGNDTLNGGAGDDYIAGGAGADIIDGGTGDDTIAFRPWHGTTGGINVDLSSNTVSNDGTGSSDTVSNVEHVDGSEHNDVITGGTGHNNLRGNEGNDVLNGGADGDYLDGGEGDDTLIAAGDNDNLHGGNGDDTFVLSDGMNVWVEDFNAGPGGVDELDLTAVANLNSLADVGAALIPGYIEGQQVEFDLDGTWDGINTVTLQGVNSFAALVADDFMF